MRTWKDSEGRTWDVTISVALLDSIKKQTQLDLAPDNYDVSTLVGLKFQSRKLAQILYICAGESIARDDFMGAIDGDVLIAGWRALVDDVIAFYAAMNPGIAEPLHALIQAQLNANDKLCDEAIAMIRSVTTEQAMQAKISKVADEMQAALVKKLGV